MRNISSVARTITGIISNTKASDTAETGSGNPSVATHGA